MRLFGFDSILKYKVNYFKTKNFFFLVETLMCLSYRAQKKSLTFIESIINFRSVIVAMKLSACLSR